MSMDQFFTPHSISRDFTRRQKNYQFSSVGLDMRWEALRCDYGGFYGFCRVLPVMTLADKENRFWRALMGHGNHWRPQILFVTHEQPKGQP
jgi:hypothetical protein